VAAGLFISIRQGRAVKNSDSYLFRWTIKDVQWVTEKFSGTRYVQNKKGTK
jgi:hypothetical protein